MTNLEALQNRVRKLNEAVEFMMLINDRLANGIGDVKRQANMLRDELLQMAKDEERGNK